VDGVAHLLARGAHATRRDTRFNNAPLGWCRQYPEKTSPTTTTPMSTSSGSWCRSRQAGGDDRGLRQGALTVRHSSGYPDDMEQPTEVAAQASSTDPAVGLGAVASLRVLLESLEALQVGRARDAGWSWQQIAAALGVTKQAAHEKHGAGKRRQRRRAR